MAEPRPRTLDLVLVPGVITLAITVLRLVGELQHWSPRFFSTAAGGAGAIVGISWLPPLFGVWFALKLVRAGAGPERPGRAILWALASLLVMPAAAGVSRLSGSMAAAIAVFAVTSLAGVWIAGRGWPALGRTLLAYALAARIPVAVVMLFAILGNWGTHYDAPPPGMPPLGPVAKWALVGLVPQLTLWIGFTVITGMVTGTITARIAGSGKGAAVRDAA